MYWKNMKIQQTTEHIVKTYAVVSPSDWDDSSGNSSVIEGELVGQDRLEDGSNH